VRTGGSIPGYVYILLVGMWLFAVWRILTAIYVFYEARRRPEPEVWAPKFQATTWVCLLVGCIAGFSIGHALVGIVLLIFAVMLPIRKRKKSPKGVEDWPGATLVP
jgi:hypothetical protein